jgi:hypothetical protein
MSLPRRRKRRRRSGCHHSWSSSIVLPSSTSLLSPCSPASCPGCSVWSRWGRAAPEDRSRSTPRRSHRAPPSARSPPRHGSAPSRWPALGRLLGPALRCSIRHPRRSAPPLADSPPALRSDACRPRRRNVDCSSLARWCSSDLLACTPRRRRQRLDQRRGRHRRAGATRGCSWSGCIAGHPRAATPAWRDARFARRQALARG